MSDWSTLVQEVDVRADPASILQGTMVQATQAAQKRSLEMMLHGLRPLFLFVAIVLCGERLVSAQEQAPTTGASPSGALVEAPRPKVRRADGDEHRFWDKTNDWLFAGVGASRTLDYFSTLNMRRRGRQEILLTDDVVDNHAAFAVIEAAGTGASIGAAYLFHRYGHHKLERWTSIVHIGLATTGSVRNYCLKTFHSTPPPSGP